MYYNFCVIGNPVAHSKSPWIHQQFAQQFQLKIDYLKISAELTNFSSILYNFMQNQGQGANITLPFKEQAFYIADTVSERARIAKSVNTLVFRKGGVIYGDNSDGIGLVQDIIRNTKYTLTAKKILIIGAGGAVRGILAPILEQKPAEILIVNRTFSKAERLSQEFQSYGSVKALSFAALKDHVVDVVIDATSRDGSNFIPSSLTLNANSLCYDLKYYNFGNFRQWALAKNSRLVVDGLGMLIEQAAYSFSLWTGKNPVVLPVINLAKNTFI